MNRQPRRQFLRVVGTGGVIGLAGCSGDDSGDDTDDATEDTASPAAADTNEDTANPSGATESMDETPDRTDEPAVDADWPTFRHDNRNTGHNPGATGPAEQPEIAWEREGFGEAYPSIVDGVLYIGGPNAVRALDAETGETEWTYEIGDRVDAAPAVAEGTVVFPAWDGSVYALSADDGSEVWVRSTSSVSDEPLDSDRCKSVSGRPHDVVRSYR